MSKKVVTKLLNKEQVAKLLPYQHNRAINKNRVSELVKYMTIETPELFDAIVVNNDTNTIGSGHHRQLAFIRYASMPGNENAKMPVEFRKFKDEDEFNEFVLRRASDRCAWTLGERIDVLRQQTTAYDAIEKFAYINPNWFLKLNRGKPSLNSNGRVIPKWNYITTFLFGNKRTKELSNGTIQVTEADINHGKQIYDELQQIIKAVGWDEDFTKGLRIDFMATKWHKIRERADFKEFLKVIRKNRRSLMVANLQTPVLWEAWFNKIMLKVFERMN